jgi:hypothetical protein
MSILFLGFWPLASRVTLMKSPNPNFLRRVELWIRRMTGMLLCPAAPGLWECARCSRVALRSACESLAVGLPTAVSLLKALYAGKRCADASHSIALRAKCVAGVALISLFAVAGDTWQGNHRPQSPGAVRVNRPYQKRANKNGTPSAPILRSFKSFSLRKRHQTLSLVPFPGSR